MQEQEVIRMFREDFVWGVASSAYQVEGTDAADGRGACVWDMFAADGRVFEHQNADTSCDHMHHYKEDIAEFVWDSRHSWERQLSV